MQVLRLYRRPGHLHRQLPVIRRPSPLTGEGLLLPISLFIAPKNPLRKTTMNALAILPPSTEQLPPLPLEDVDRAANFARQDKSPATRAAYQSDFRIFRNWLRLPQRERTTGHG